MSTTDQTTTLAEAVQIALGEIGEAVMKDGGARDRGIERACDVLRDAVAQATAPSLVAAARDARDGIAREIGGHDRDVARSVAKLRVDLDRVDEALASGFRIGGSISGDSFVESDARDLGRAIRDRQASYDQLALLDDVLRAWGDEA